MQPVLSESSRQSPDFSGMDVASRRVNMDRRERALRRSDLSGMDGASCGRLIMDRWGRALRRNAIVGFIQNFFVRRGKEYDIIILSGEEEVFYEPLNCEKEKRGAGNHEVGDVRAMRD